MTAKKTRGILFYRISWLNKDLDITWYKCSQAKYTLKACKDFHLQHPAKPGPPLLLREWLQAWEDGKDDYDELDDSRVATEDLRTDFFQKGG